MIINWLVKKLMPPNEVFMTPEERAYYAEEARMLKLRNDLIEEGRRKRKEREEAESVFRAVASIKLENLKLGNRPINVRITLSENARFRRWEVSGASYRDGRKESVPSINIEAIKRYIKSSCDEYFDLILPWIDGDDSIKDIAEKSNLRNTSLLKIY